MHLERQNPNRTLQSLQSAYDTRAEKNRCAYIEGEPTKQDYRRHGIDRFKCGAPTKTGSAWCDYHHSICFVRPKQSP
jgi:hypothetical protein